MSTSSPTAVQALVDEPQPPTALSHEQPTTPTTHAIFSKSSPTRKGRFFAQHKLAEVQRFGYHKETHKKADFEKASDLIEFLKTPDAFNSDQLPDVRFSVKTVRPDFLAKVNTMSKSIYEKYFKDTPSRLVVFKDTESKIPRAHPTDTICRPDITAAFEDYFGTKNDTTSWPYILLAGEWASTGSTLEAQDSKAISYLHYLLLARPDLYLAQGLLASEKSITFLVGIGGFGVRELKLGWGDEELPKLLYAFIHHTYSPGPFADPSYKLDPEKPEKPPTWTITLEVKSDAGEVTAVSCPNFLPVYASSPFETRTHVFVMQGESVDVDGKKLAVLKDQVCRTGTRFNEHSILEHVHKSKRVPGVVEAVYHKSIDLPFSTDLGVGRVKHRHGLRQLGSPFMTIPTLKEMLQVAFDTVEVLRFLKADRNILHRDISAGNVMYVQEPDISSEGDEDLHFSGFFLGGSSPKSPQTTSVLLVDFNHAEHLASKREEHIERVERTGTAVFMSRAVELGRAMHMPPDPFIREIPPAPEQYADHYQDRLQRFPPTPAALFQVPAKPKSAPWRHELDHDVESVFWLMLYWAMTAQPKGEEPQPIQTSSWSSLTGGVNAREGLLYLLYSGAIDAGTFHSTFQPHFTRLFKPLARILSSVDRHWLDPSETRNNPEYFAEAFQRLILQFLIDHPSGNDNGFMDVEIDEENPRRPDGHITSGPHSSTTNQRLHATSQAKRTSDTAGDKEHKLKRSRQ